MSTSLGVVGIKPPDDKWKQMRLVYNACKIAGLSPPKEVEDFFKGEEPDPKGVVEELGSEYHKNHECCTRYTEEMTDGFEVDLKKLPKDITILRFVISY